MNRPNPAEEQEAARLEEFLTALRQNPDAIPANKLNPGIAEISRLAAESERTGSQLSSQYVEKARNRVWQKALANLETEQVAVQASQAVLPIKPSGEGRTRAKNDNKPVYLLPGIPARKARPISWPRVVLGGMAATIVVILLVFIVLLLTPGPQTPVSQVVSGSTQPTPGQTALATSNPAVRVTPTQPPQPTQTPVPSFKVILQIAADKFTSDQANATAKVLENRMLALGFTYAKATVDGNQINMNLRGTVSKDVVMMTASAIGRVEFVDTSNAVIQVGDRLQTTYCTSGSLLKPLAGLCALTATNTAPGVTPIATGRTTVDEKLFQTVLTGEDLDPASLQLGKSDVGNDNLLYKFKPEAAVVMKNFTEANQGKQMAITIDGAVIVNATVQGVISEAGELTTPSKLSLDDLIAFVKSGPLPLPVAGVTIS